MFGAKSAGVYRDSLVASPNICGANNPPSVLRHPLSISCGNFPFLFGYIMLTIWAQVNGER
jgi:hypothetical protein